MDQDHEEGPKKKRVKLSLEILPETRIEKFDADGTEEHEKLMTPEDRFMTFVRQLDFLGKEKEEIKPTNPDDTKWAKLKKKVDFHIGHAHGEINQMVNLLNMLKTQPHNLDLIPCQRPPMTEKKIQDHAVAQIAFKKAQLAKASQRLQAAVSSLESDVSRYQQYLQDADKLRQNWKVGCPLKTIPHDYSPIFNVDFTYRNDGSRVRNLPPTNIIRAEGTEGIQVKIPLDQLSRTLVISNETTTTSIPIVYELDNKENKSANCTFNGFDEVHQMFLNAQESLFTWEIFDSITKAAHKSKKVLFQHQESEIKFETASEEIFSVKLLKQKPNSGDDFEMKLKPSFSFGYDFMFRIMGLMLHTQIRKKHRKQMQDDHRPKLARDFLRENVDSDDPALQNLMFMYEHMKSYFSVLKSLQSLKMKHPSLSFRTVNTDNAFVSSFDLFYEGQPLTYFDTSIGHVSRTVD